METDSPTNTITYTLTDLITETMFSIEKGYPHWHQEIRMDDNPLEAGLLFTCKLRNVNVKEAKQVCEHDIPETSSQNFPILSIFLRCFIKKILLAIVNAPFSHVASYMYTYD